MATVFRIPHAGGAGTHIELLVSMLTRKRIFKGLICGNNLRQTSSRKLGYLISRLMNADNARVRLLEPTVERVAKSIAKLSRTGAGDDLVIHCHDPLSTCAALRSGIQGAAVIQTVHGPWSKENQGSGLGPGTAFNRAIQRLEEKAFAAAHLLLPVDRGQAAILQKEFGVEERRIRVIENAVDVERLGAVHAVYHSARMPIHYFLVPRRLVPKNGVEFAIRGFARIGHHDAGLVIAGAGFLRRSLEKLSRELGVSGRVKFLGEVPRERLLPLMKRSEAVVVPSVPADGVVEATSLSVLEAMAIGVPVIGSAIGGINEIIADDSMGFLTPPRDPEAISRAMEAVLALDETSRGAVVQNALSRVREKFGSEAWIERIVSLYQEALGKAPRMPDTQSFSQ